MWVEDRPAVRARDQPRKSDADDCAERTLNSFSHVFLSDPDYGCLLAQVKVR